jgi:hypothetical protein
MKVLTSDPTHLFSFVQPVILPIRDILCALGNGKTRAPRLTYRGGCEARLES